MTIKGEIKKIIEKSLKELKVGTPDFLVEPSLKEEHGDYASNIALVLAKQLKKNPLEIAEDIKKKIKSGIFEKIEILKPGFINFFISKEHLQKQAVKILKEKEKYGNLKIGRRQKVNVEFISANPTGPLTLGNGRGGFGGDVLANVLRKAGYNAVKEYYINNQGKQIKDLKEGLYKGEKRTASQIQKENKKVIEKKLKINFDVWFSEKSLYKNKEINKVINYLQKKKLTCEKEGALWFKTTKFGDDKDRVLIRKNGEKTYFASDTAYLKNKFKRGFKKLIIFLGADHHGYVKRMKAAVEALGYNKNQLDFILMQMVRLKKGKMSKRSGVYIKLEELIDEVGLNAARFFFLQRGANSHLVFDMDLAKKKSRDNPVYYVQYAYARISSILSKAQNANFQFPIVNFQLLTHENELRLIKQLIRFPEIIEDTAKDYQVQRFPQYAVDLAEAFHRFYQNCQVLTDNKKLRQSRLSLISAAEIILKETLNLMGIDAPQKM